MRQLKKQTRNFFGFRRINIADESSSSENDPLVYKFTPVGIGRLMSLREKFEAVIGDPFLVFSIKGKQRKVVINPLFDLLVWRQIHTEYLNQTKNTNIEANLLTDLTADPNKDKQQALKNHLNKLFSEFKGHKVYAGSRKQKLKRFEEIISQEKYECLKQLRLLYTVDGPESITKRGQQYILQVTEEMASNVLCILNMRASQQYQLYNFYKNFTKDFFGISFIVERKNSKNYICIKMFRPFRSIENILTSVRDHVELRESKVQYREMAIQMVKDILTELKKFQITAVTEKGRLFYEWLSPDTVIFDQTKLMPKLSLIPILHQMLGIKRKPMSIQARIAFEPTPKEFDYFQSTHQLQQDNQLILKDIFYGYQDLYDKDNQISNKDNFKIQQEQIQKTKELIVIDRFLLLSHFNIKGFQFGRLKKICNMKGQQKYFVQSLKKKKQQLSRDMSKLNDFFDFQNKSTQNLKFNFLLSQILEYLSIQTSDSFLQISKYHKIIKHSKLRNNLISQLIRNLVNQTLFTKIYNLKKYIFMFLLIVIAIIEQSNKLVTSERMKPGERKNIRIYLENAKKVRTQKNHAYYLENTLTRIEKYKNRDNNSDIQAKYINQDEIGQKTYAYVRELYDQVTKLNKYNDSMNDIENSTDRDDQKNRKYTNLLNFAQTCIRVNYQKSKTILTELINLQLKVRHKDGPHKIPQQHAKVRDFFQYYTKRLQLIFHTFLTLNENNLITYEALVIPLLKIEDHEEAKKIEIPKVYITKEQDEEILKNIEEFFCIKKNSIRKMQYFTKSSAQKAQSCEKSYQFFQLPGTYQQFQNLFTTTSHFQHPDSVNLRK